MLRSVVVGFYRLSSSRITCRFASTSGRSAAKASRNSRKWKKWTPLPLGVGFAYIAYQQYGHVREREDRQRGVTRESRPFKPWQVSFYSSLPLRMESRLFGWLAKREIPTPLRAPIIGLFAWATGCDLSEPLEEDLSKYHSLNEFFRRPMKPELRPIAKDCLVCPADGQIQACGRLLDDKIEQVKGYSYTLAAFVGSDLAEELLNRRTKSSGNELYYCVIYLSPADCHRFYAPAQWSINFRRHITGHLLGVNKKVVSKVPHVLSINERVLLSGQWQYGYFSMTPVGATHVGSIVLDCESSLKTNLPTKCVGDTCDLCYRSIKKKPGDYIGEFNMGSSVVLIFEGPKKFQFVKNAGERLKHGESLGKV